MKKLFAVMLLAASAFAQITVIQGTDAVSNGPNIINGNFAYLNSYCVDSGVTNTVTCSMIFPSSYQPGQQVDVLMAHTNTGPVKISVNGLPQLDVKSKGSLLVGGEMVAGGIVPMQFDGAAMQIKGGTTSGVTPPGGGYTGTSPAGVALPGTCKQGDTWNVTGPFTVPGTAPAPGVYFCGPQLTYQPVTNANGYSKLAGTAGEYGMDPSGNNFRFNAVSGGANINVGPLFSVTPAFSAVQVPAQMQVCDSFNASLGTSCMKFTVNTHSTRHAFLELGSFTDGTPNTGFDSLRIGEYGQAGGLTKNGAQQDTQFCFGTVNLQGQYCPFVFDRNAKFSLYDTGVTTGVGVTSSGGGSLGIQPLAANTNGLVRIAGSGTAGASGLHVLNTSDLAEVNAGYLNVAVNGTTNGAVALGKAGTGVVPPALNIGSNPSDITPAAMNDINMWFSGVPGFNFNRTGKFTIFDSAGANGVSASNVVNSNLPNYSVLAVQPVVTNQNVSIRVAPTGTAVQASVALLNTPDISYANTGYFHLIANGTTSANVVVGKNGTGTVAPTMLIGSNVTDATPSFNDIQMVYSAVPKFNFNRAGIFTIFDSAGASGVNISDISAGIFQAQPVTASSGLTFRIVPSGTATSTGLRLYGGNDAVNSPQVTLLNLGTGAQLAVEAGTAGPIPGTLKIGSGTSDTLAAKMTEIDLMFTGVNKYVFDRNGVTTVSSTAAPATPAAGSGAHWWDATSKAPVFVNDAGQLYVAAKPLTPVLGFAVTGMGPDGTFTTAAFTGGTGGGGGPYAGTSPAGTALPTTCSQGEMWNVTGQFASTPLIPGPGVYFCGPAGKYQITPGKAATYTKVAGSAGEYNLSTTGATFRFNSVFAGLAPLFTVGPMAGDRQIQAQSQLCDSNATDNGASCFSILLNGHATRHVFLETGTFADGSTNAGFDSLRIGEYAQTGGLTKAGAQQDTQFCFAVANVAAQYCPYVFDKSGKLSMYSGGTVNVMTMMTLNSAAFAFQNGSVNVATVLRAIPNGISPQSSFVAQSSSDAAGTNTGTMTMGFTGTKAVLSLDVTGTGQLPGGLLQIGSGADPAGLLTTTAMMFNSVNRFTFSKAGLFTINDNAGANGMIVSNLTSGGSGVGVLGIQPVAGSNTNGVVRVAPVGSGGTLQSQIYLLNSPDLTQATGAYLTLSAGSAFANITVGRNVSGTVPPIMAIGSSSADNGNSMNDVIFQYTGRTAFDFNRSNGFTMTSPTGDGLTQSVASDGGFAMQTTVANSTSVVRIVPSGTGAASTLTLSNIASTVNQNAGTWNMFFSRTSASLLAGKGGTGVVPSVVQFGSNATDASPAGLNDIQFLFGNVVLFDFNKSGYTTTMFSSTPAAPAAGFGVSWWEISNNTPTFRNATTTFVAARPTAVVTGQFLTGLNADGSFTTAAGGSGGGTPGGPPSSVQINSSGVFGGSANLAADLNGNLTTRAATIFDSAGANGVALGNILNANLAGSSVLTVQSALANQNTNVRILPNGTGTQGSVMLLNMPDLTDANTGYLNIVANGTTSANIVVGKNGTGVVPGVIQFGSNVTDTVPSFNDIQMIYTGATVFDFARTGTLAMTGAANAQINMSSPAAGFRVTNFSTGASIRWQVGVDNSAESGSNAGANWYMNRYTDAGAAIDAPIFVSRATGSVRLLDGWSTGAAAASTMTAAGALTATSNLIRKDSDSTTSPGTAQLTIQGATNTNKMLWVGFDTTVNAGSIQAGISGSTWNALLLNPNGGFVGVGANNPLPVAQLHVSGVAPLPNPNVNVAMPGTLLLDDTQATAGSGGMLAFSAAATGWRFAAIKGYATNGTPNTLGDIVFYTRRAPADTNLTETLRVTSTGSVSFGKNGTAYITEAGALAVTSCSGCGVGAGGAAGTQGQVQWYNSGQFGASADLFFNPGSHFLTVGTNTGSGGVQAWTLQTLAATGNQLSGNSYSFAANGGMTIGAHSTVATSGGGAAINNSTASASITAYDLNGGCSIGTGIGGSGISCSSDSRLKKNVRSITDGLTPVLGLRPVYFDWTGDNSPNLGFIAQEVQAILPQLVTKDSATDMLSLSQGGMIPYLVKAVQQLEAEIAALKAAK